MQLLTVIFVAVGLSMDAFAISIVSGAAYKQLHIRHAIRMAAFFGGFQALMPLVGYLAGMGLKQFISSYDHWVAFTLLVGVGIKMIYESFKMKSSKEAYDPANLLVLLMLAVATSIDALAIGITLSFLTGAIVLAALTIGGVTFVLSAAGVYIGKRFGHFFESRIEAFGGVVLIAIGLKILVQHIYA